MMVVTLCYFPVSVAFPYALLHVGIVTSTDIHFV